MYYFVTFRCFRVISSLYFQFLKYPYFPHERDFFPRPPPPFEIPIKLHHTFLKFLVLETPLLPPPPQPSRKFQSLLSGEFGYFPELQIVLKGLSALAYQRSQWLIYINSCRSFSFFHHLIYSVKTLF